MDDTTTTTTTTSKSLPALKRVPPRQYRPRPVFWHQPGTHALLQSQPTEGLVDMAPYGTSLGGVLMYVSHWCHANKHREAIVYLTGGWDAASTQPADYYREPLIDTWRVSSWRTGPMAVTYESLGMKVHVRVAAAWFDETPITGDPIHDVLTLAHGYDDLLHSLRKHFGKGAYLLGTPAQTGLDLLEQSLPYGLELPVLPQELRELIQHNSPQGRNEVLTAPDGINSAIETLPALQCYDAKWMYAACLSHVPAGRYEHAIDPSFGLPFDEWVVGFYYYYAVIPRDWHHIGLLPVYSDRTIYPWQPGTVLTGWATGAELQLAQQNGWLVRIGESIIWPDAQKLNPLRTWHDKLVAARAEAEAAGNDLVATALRHILIDALGALARHETRVHHITPHDQHTIIPDAPASSDVNIRPWGIEWDSYEPVSDWAAPFQHPEISAMVWGRARARLAKFALDIPVERCILARTDAWWIAGNTIPAGTGVLPEFVRTHPLKPGEWREKEHLSGPDIPAPRDTSQALVLMRRARGKEVAE